MSKLLIADDDVELCQLLQDYLTREGFSVACVHNGEDALSRIASETFELLILDVMMPKKNGFDTLAELRHTQQIPVIMLTAKGEKIDRIIGLEMGADDYLPKPCDPRELLARIRAVTRRTQLSAQQQQADDSITIDKVKLDYRNRSVCINGESLETTSTEFEILTLLMKNAGHLVTKENISEHCLGKKLQPFDRSIDMHLSNLRKKLGDFQPNKPRIKTVRGSGYQYLEWSHA
ncbi:response regulator [Aliikangiella sp. IMCC44653]